MQDIYGLQRRYSVITGILSQIQDPYLLKRNEEQVQDTLL